MDTTKAAFNCANEELLMIVNPPAPAATVTSGAAVAPGADPAAAAAAAVAAADVSKLPGLLDTTATPSVATAAALTSVADTIMLRLPMLLHRRRSDPEIAAAANWTGKEPGRLNPQESLPRSLPKGKPMDERRLANLEKKFSYGPQKGGRGKGKGGKFHNPKRSPRKKETRKNCWKFLTCLRRLR